MGKEPVEVDDLKDTNEIVHAALLELAKLYDDLIKSKVTGREVENYRKHANSLQVLCEAANLGSSQLAPQFTEIDSAMQNCVDKLNTIKEYREKLAVVMEYCKPITSKGTYTYVYPLFYCALNDPIHDPY